MCPDTLKADRVEIRGFGSFGYRPHRQRRNPRSGDMVAVPAKYAPHFKPSKELREGVDKGDSNILNDHSTVRF